MPSVFTALPLTLYIHMKYIFYTKKSVEIIYTAKQSFRGHLFYIYEAKNILCPYAFYILYDLMQLRCERVMWEFTIINHSIQPEITN